MRCIGHRGARGHRPENTLAGFAEALRLGALAVELDVHVCAGEAVVIHDATVNRTTNGQGPVNAFSLPALQALDAGAGEHIPRLTEVLDLINRRAGVNIELKGEGSAVAVARIIADYCRRGWPAALFLVSAFDWAMLADFRHHDGHTRIGLLFEKPTPDLEAVSATLRSHAWHPRHNQVSPALLARARRCGQKLYPYTVNHPARLRRLHALGVDGVFTDYPERARPFQHETQPGFD